MNRRELFQFAVGAAVVPLAADTSKPELIQHDEENSIYTIDAMKFREEYLLEFERGLQRMAEQAYYVDRLNIKPRR